MCVRVIGAGIEDLAMGRAVDAAAVGVPARGVGGGCRSDPWSAGVMEKFGSNIQPFRRLCG